MAEAAAIPRLLEKYRSQVAPALRERFSYANPMQIPKLDRVSVNVGLGEALQNARLLGHHAVTCRVKAAQATLLVHSHNPRVRSMRRSFARRLFFSVAQCLRLGLAPCMLLRFAPLPLLHFTLLGAMLRLCLCLTLGFSFSVALGLFFALVLFLFL